MTCPRTKTSFVTIVCALMCIWQDAAAQETVNVIVKQTLTRAFEHKEDGRGTGGRKSWTDTVELKGWSLVNKNKDDNGGYSVHVMSKRGPGTSGPNISVQDDVITIKGRTGYGPITRPGGNVKYTITAVFVKVYEGTVVTRTPDSTAVVSDSQANYLSGIRDIGSQLAVLNAMVLDHPPIADDADTKHIQASAGKFEDWYLDLAGSDKHETQGRFHISNNVLLTKQKVSPWHLTKTEKGSLIQVSNRRTLFHGWHLDFDNKARKERKGRYDFSRCLILALERGRGTYWEVKKTNKGFTIQATAGNYKGWYLDFDNQGEVFKDGRFDFGRNLILTKQLGSGGYWLLD